MRMSDLWSMGSGPSEVRGGPSMASTIYGSSIAPAPIQGPWVTAIEEG